MKLGKTIIKRLLQAWLRFRAKLKLKQLRHINPTVDKVVTAIDDALRNNLTFTEKVCVDQIEELRSALNASPTEISLADYGAGEPNFARTGETMYQGVATTMTVSSICKVAAKSYFWALVLFKLVREFKPSSCIELGTSLGISAAYQAAALKINNKGRIITLEGANALATLSGNNLKKLGLDNAVVVCGRFQDHLERILIENEPIDFAFIDGHHEEKATISYFESFIPHLSKKSVIILDDVDWSDGMRHAWEKVVENKNVKIAMNLRHIGICVFDNEIESKFSFQIPLI